MPNTNLVRDQLPRPAISEERPLGEEPDNPPRSRSEPEGRVTRGWRVCAR
jgi:hypothetical protein